MPLSFIKKLSSESLQFLAMAFLSLVTLWEQIQNDAIRAVDAPIYALIGKELSEKSLSQWAVMTFNGKEFFDHPHFTPWILGLTMKLFGVTTLSALMPIVILSTLTVTICYLLGKELHSHSFGLLAGTILAFTPAFIKDGRNPMLEPALMFWIMLAIYAHLRELSVLAGMSFGFALLSKGPPAFIAPAVMISFEILVYYFPKSFPQFSKRSFSLLKHFALVFFIPVAMIALLDGWHYLLTQDSFFLQYLHGQINNTVVNARGVTSNVWMFYANNFYEYYPWVFFIYLGIALVIWKKDRKAIPALAIGSLTTFGIFLGFTLMIHKGYWYTNFHYCSSSLLAALGLSYLIPQRWMKHYSRFAMIVGVTTVFFAASFPSLFFYPRPLESFLENASRSLGTSFKGQNVADCVNLDGWRQAALVKYYLNVEKVDCESSNASLKLVDARQWTGDAPYRIVFAQQPYLLIQK